MVSRNKDGFDFTTQGTLYPNGDRDAQIPHYERSLRNHSERLKCFVKSHRETVRLGLSCVPKHSCSEKPDSVWFLLSGCNVLMFAAEQMIYDDLGNSVFRYYLVLPGYLTSEILDFPFRG
jgi:hypothetical protein